MFSVMVKPRPTSAPHTIPSTSPAKAPGASRRIATSPAAFVTSSTIGPPSAGTNARAPSSPATASTQTDSASFMADARNAAPSAPHMNAARCAVKRAGSRRPGKISTAATATGGRVAPSAISSGAVAITRARERAAPSAISSASRTRRRTAMVHVSRVTLEGRTASR